MNLAEYKELDFVQSATDYIRFENTGDTKHLRFLYTSGGDKMGEDIVFRRKFWDESAHKYVWDTDEGSYVAQLQAIEYDPDGKNPRKVVWERSAYFCKTVLLPMWKNYPRIIDGVWKVSATSPRTKDASYSLFPVVDATTATYPIIEETSKADFVPQIEPKVTPVVSVKKAEEKVSPAQSPAKKKYWE